MVFCETDPQRAEPHWMEHKRMFKECRGLCNLSGSKTKGAYDVRVFVAVIGIYCLNTMQEGCYLLAKYLPFGCATWDIEFLLTAHTLLGPNCSSSLHGRWAFHLAVPE